MPFVSYKGCSVEYSTEGNGHGLIFIHGTGQSADNTWSEAVKHFAPTHKVVCPNYSGSGRTTDAGQKLSVSFLAEQILAAADHAGVNCFDVVGHSLGTCVAMHLAATHPDRVEKVVLLAGFISSSDTRLQLQFRMWKELLDTDQKLLSKLFLLSGFSPCFLAKMPEHALVSTVEEIYRTTNWRGVSRQIDLDLNVDMSHEVKRIHQKTLVIGCTHDFIVPISHSKCLLEAIQNSEYCELDTGHAGIVENPSQFIDCLSRFLA